MKDLVEAFDNIVKDIETKVFDMWYDTDNMHDLSVYELIASAFNHLDYMELLDKYFFCVDGLIVVDKDTYRWLLDLRNEGSQATADYKYFTETIVYMIEYYLMKLPTRDTLEANIIRDLLNKDNTINKGE
jgi:hypothetical protein